MTALQPAIVNATAARRARWLAGLLVVVACLHNAAMSWQTWGDPIIDTGRELEVPRQLADGLLLYRDVRYWYGPLAPYLHALLYRIFGAHVSVLQAAGLTLVALTAWVQYRTARLVADRLVAAVAAALFCYVCAFGHYYVPNIFNFVLPYAFPAAYGALLASASVFFLMRFARSARPRDLLCSGGLLGLAALCKLEMLVAALAAHAAFGLLAIARRRAALRAFAPAYALALAIPLAVYLPFQRQIGTRLWSDNLFIAGNVLDRGYLLRHSGLDNWRASAVELALSAAAWGGCAFLALMASVIATALSRGASDGDSAKQLSSAGPRAPALLAAAACLLLMSSVDALLTLRAAPLLLGAALLIRTARRLRRDAAAPDRSPEWLLLVFALAALARIALRVQAAHYGFYLLVPGLTALSVVLVGRPRGPQPRWLSLRQVCSLAALAGVAWGHYRLSADSRAVLLNGPGTNRVSGPRGTLPLPLPYLGTVNAAVSYLREHAAGKSVIVAPEGIGLAFLAGGRDAVGLHTFMPPDFCGSFDDAGVIRALEASPPDFVVLNSRSTLEYGRRGLGIDYGIGVARWIGSHTHRVTGFASANFAVEIRAKN